MDDPTVDDEAGQQSDPPQDQAKAADPAAVAGPENQATGNDGFSEDDVPMMSVGPPTPTDPNQVTTKPRQMPAGSAPAPGMGQGMPPGTDGADLSGDNSGEQPPAPGQFDPSAMGADVQGQRAENNDTSTNKEDSVGDIQSDSGAKDGDLNFKAQIEVMAKEAIRLNPGLSVEAAVDIAGEAFMITAGAWDHVADGPLNGSIEPLVKRFFDRSRTHDEQGHPVPTTAPPTIGDRLRGHEKQLQQGVEDFKRSLTPSSTPISQQVRTWWNQRGRPPAPPRPPGQGAPVAPSPVSQTHPTPYAPALPGSVGTPTPAPYSGGGSSRSAQPRQPEQSGEDRMPDEAPESYEQQPKTVGDFVRQQMHKYPDDHELRKDVWHLRHSTEPMGHHESSRGSR